jgi:hypothetical protein
MERELLQTATKVIDALGGTAATARLTKRKIQSVSNWRATGRLPSDTFLVMSKALDDVGKAAPISLWGMAPAQEPSQECAAP